MLDARTRRRWRLRDNPDDTLPQTAAISAIAHDLGLPPLVARLLVLRGVADAACARRFLKPRLSDLTEPTLIPGVPRAAERIARAVREGQPIVIYGDYDVDGVTASATLWHILKACGARVTTYVPHRIDEGYGLNEEAIAKIANGEWGLANGQSGDKPLIISVDCGITACGPAKVAKDLGADLIITDHHHFDPAQLPDAHTLVHPALPCDGGDTVGEAAQSCRDLCGAGVAFKLAWQVARACCGSERVSEPMKELLLDLLSLVALGTVADVVPLTGENRVLTIFGLSRVKHTRFVGLNALIDASRLRDEKVSSYHVGFVLGPRLNACGRMGHAARAVHLLTEATEDEARETAEFLTGENDKRRATERAIFEEAKQMVIDTGGDSDDRRAIVVGKDGWHSGVVGIVASRLVEAFGRPAIVLSIDESGQAHGSARSVEGVSIHEAIAACQEHLDRFGGHAMAAGLGLRSEAIEAFREALIAEVNQRLSVDDLVSVLRYDAEVTLADCEIGLFTQIERLEPFGRGNPAPMLLLRNVTLDRPADRMGQNGKHLSMLLRQNGRMMRAVAFNMGDLADQLPGGVTLDVLFEPKLSVWQGQKRVELHVRDLRRAGDE